MSFSNLSDFFDLSLFDDSTASTTDKNLSIGQFLEQPSTSALKPDWFTGSEINDYSSTNLELKDQFSTTGLFAPLPSDIVHEISKPFDGKIPIIDTYTADVVRYIQRTGKVPNVNVFTSEDDDVDTVVSHTDNVSDYTELQSTPIRRKVVPLPKRGNQRISLSTESDASDYAGANSVRVKVPTPAPLFHPKDESPTKKAKRRKTFKSADNLVYFAPVLTPANIASRTSHSDSPPTSSPGPLNAETPTTSKVTTKKRKLNDIARDEDCDETDDDENVTVKNHWTRVSNKDYSSRRINGKIRFRCDQCWEQEKRSHICSSQGDMARHLQSEKHAPKAFMCCNTGCRKDYTRKDALKRHMATCKHSTTNYAR